jgi:tRNA nucleotidyltransferase (CCA-adding enzyme)
LNGKDLIELGYRRGPEFKTILDAVLVATLDDVIQTRDMAIAWLEIHFPVQENQF